MPRLRWREAPRKGSGVVLACQCCLHAGRLVEQGAPAEAVPVCALQYGHVLKTKIWDAEWCIYLKGGSAYFILAGNTVYNCGSSGISVGQGTGFEYMISPWLRYEAYDIKVRLAGFVCTCMACSGI